MTKLIIDTDCGMDDIIAIAMLIASKKFEIAGITTVRGLTPSVTGAKNIDKIMTYLDQNVPVIAGANSPLNKSALKNKFPTKDIVNSSKLVFLKDLLPIVIKQNNDINNFWEQEVCLSRKSITLVCLGPLTNIAKAMLNYGYKFTSKINQVVIMGGAINVAGNVKPEKLAEYNFYLDPEAAKIVLTSSLKILLVPMDATRQAPVSEKLNNQIEKLNPKTKEGLIIKKTLLANKNDFRYFYDPLAVSSIINQRIIKKTKLEGLRITSQGQSVIDLNQKPKVKIVLEVKSEKFYNTLVNSILAF